LIATVPLIDVSYSYEMEDKKYTTALPLPDIVKIIL
jgi:hypothetical protein